MTEFLQALAPWISPIILLIQIFFGGFVLLMSRKFATQEQHQDVVNKVGLLDSRTARHENKIRRLEDDLDDLPDAEALHKLSLQITQLEGRLQTFAVKFDSVRVLGDRMQKQIDMMDEFLKRGVSR